MHVYIYSLFMQSSSSGTTHNFSIASTTETEFVEFFKTDEMDEADDVPI